ncbi:hypothetical protein B296_00023259 [Ensete ventricosum]|uniref:Uncharacterized protein n=1 Tax=Ensete ventricosum TaxID=4639 RepID=A0A426Z6C7_ENSVE|nr:hypothetical protein B296_00023259 [Ensete ventricosum]
MVTKVCNFNLYRPVRAVYTGPPGCRYADRSLSGGTAKNRPSAIDFGRWRSIKGEIGLIEGEKGKKKKRKRRKKKRRRRKPSVALARGSSPPSPARRFWASALARFFSRTRRRNVSPEYNYWSSPTLQPLRSYLCMIKSPQWDPLVLALENLPWGYTTLICG